MSNGRAAPTLTTSRTASLPLRHAAARHLATAALVALAACGGEASPHTSCPAAPFPGVTFGPEAATVQAGFRYDASLNFPLYPCIKRVDHCLPIPGYSICTSEEVQGTCSPGIELLEGPEGATAYGRVLWQTSRADEGRRAAFRVVTRYPAECAQLEQAWTVDVLPAPPLPAIRGATVDRAVIRAGERVTLVAEFDGGLASWGTDGADFGVLTSGTPAISPPLAAGRAIRVRVVNPLGEVVEQPLGVQVWARASVRFFTATPAVIGDPANVVLSWAVEGASEAEFSPQPANPVPGLAGYAVVHVASTTTFTVTARNPLGDVATASATVTQVDPPRITGLASTPAKVAVGEGPVLLATFTGAAGRLSAFRCPIGWTCPEEPLGPIESGVPFQAPPQRGVDRYLLTVLDGVGRSASAELEVPVLGGGSFAPALPAWTYTAGPRLAALQDGRVLMLGGWSQPSGLVDVLDVDAGTARRLTSLPAAWIPAAAVLQDGRVVYSGNQAGEPGTDPAPLHLVDPADGAVHPLWPALPPGNYAGGWSFGGVLPLGGTKVFAVGASAVVDVETGAYEQASNPDQVYTGGAGCRLADGRALLNHGWAIFDHASGVVARTEMPVHYLYTPALACLEDGTALRIGEHRPDRSTVVVEVQRFDPATTAWALVGELPITPGAAVEFRPGRVLLVTPTEGWVLEVGTGEVTRVGRLAVPRDPARLHDGLFAVALPDGRAVIHGVGAMAVPEVFTP